MNQLPKYDPAKSYQWNFDHAPDPLELEIPRLPGKWKFAGLDIDSPIGIPAGPLLNGRWCLYYASLGFDFLTYKTVRSVARDCYPMPNLLPVNCGSLHGREDRVMVTDEMQGSWAVSFGMPSKSPGVWRKDVEETRTQLPKGKLLSVSVVGTVQNGWSIEQLSKDYAQCARWAVDSGADCIETNFSCPNVRTCDGQLFQNPEQAAIVAAHVRESIGQTPFLVKVGHVESSDEIAQLLDALSPFVSGVAMTNSVAVAVADRANRLFFDGQPRGICGAAILEASIRQTGRFADQIEASRLSLELVGVGGVSSASDFRKYLSVGANSIHIATAAMTNPMVGIEIKRQLAGDIEQCFPAPQS